MPRLIDRRIATLTECPADVSAPHREDGILELYASERLHPGWHFVVFYYNPGLHPDPADPGFETTKFFQTATHPMTFDGNKLILSRDNKSRYVFELRD